MASGFVKGKGFHAKARRKKERREEGLRISVIPAKAGISSRPVVLNRPETPAFAGVTKKRRPRRHLRAFLSLLRAFA